MASWQSGVLDACCCHHGGSHGGLETSTVAWPESGHVGCGTVHARASTAGVRWLRAQACGHAGTSKDGAGRVALHHLTGLPLLYTIEANYNSARHMPDVSAATGASAADASPVSHVHTPQRFDQDAFHQVRRAFCAPRRSEVHFTEVARHACPAAGGPQHRAALATSFRHVLRTQPCYRRRPAGAPQERCCRHSSGRPGRCGSDCAPALHEHRAGMRAGVSQRGGFFHSACCST
jgi:hypothetical protein